MKYSSANNNSMVPAIFALVVSGSLLSVSAWSDELVQEILAIEADPDYGEYLSAECMTCHKAEQSDTNIPVIHGKDAADLVTALLEYKNGQRNNETMQSVAGALGNDEIAALAAYLSRL